MSTARPSRTTRSSTQRALSPPPPPPTNAASRTRKPSLKAEPPTTTTHATRRLFGSTARTSTSAAPAPPAARPSRFSNVRPIAEEGASVAQHGPTSSRAPTPSGRAPSSAGAPAGKGKAPERGSSLAGYHAEPQKGCGGDGLEVYDPAREPLHAFLRIRPSPPDTSASYIQVKSSSEIIMVPPADHRLNPSTSGMFGASLIRSNNNLSSITEEGGAAIPPVEPQPFGTLYKFTQVFSSDSQAAFFRATTLPMVHDFLKGQNCLLFAYGPTGSGKTWTVQGGEGEGAGLLPRVMDVVCRSLKGKENRANVKKMRLAGIGEETQTPSTSAPTKEKPFLAPGDGLRPSMAPIDTTDVIDVDEGYDYTIWVSYVEIYNEKISDLFEPPRAEQRAVSTTSTASHSMFSAGLGLLGFGGKAKAMVRNFSTVKRAFLPLKHDKVLGHYAHGAKEIQVHSAEEARNLLEKGQRNRRVFSTVQNEASSRSHAIFIIKVVKTVRGRDVHDPSASRTSKFHIVDLAGSERVVNTQTTGDRLKEAANINTSLMVLGQCMETLRKNQELPKGRKPNIVPFNHSILTKMFQSFFSGDGKAAMIVNVNPHNTGFDENSHVMRFSAIAKGVLTAKDAPPQPALPPLKKEPYVVRLSLVEGGEEEDVVYEEDEEEDFDEDEDPVVKTLVEELAATRVMLLETQMRTTLAESRVRAKTIREYEAKLSEMEARYEDRLRAQALEAEELMNAKLDVLTRFEQEREAIAYASSDSDTEEGFSSEEEEEGASQDLEQEGDQESEEDEEEEEEQVEEMLVGETSLADADSSMEPSPSAGLHAHVRALSIHSPLDTPLPANNVPRLSSADTEPDPSPNASRIASGSPLHPLPSESSMTSADESVEAVEVPAASVPKPKPASESSATKGKAGSASKGKRLALLKSTVDNQDEMSDFDRSIIMPTTGTVKKAKRKLGGLKVTDVETLEEAYGVLGSQSARSFVSQASGTRSIRR